MTSLYHAIGITPPTKSKVRTPEMVARDNSARITAILTMGGIAVFTLASVIGVLAFVDDPDQRLGLVTILLAQTPATFAGIRALIIADRVDEKTDKVLNGHMDAKMRSAIRQVIEERWGDTGPSRTGTKRVD